MNDWKISCKLAAAFAVVVFCLCAMTVVVVTSLSTVHTKAADTQRSNDQMTAVDGVSKSMADMSGQVRGYMLTGDAAFSAGDQADQATVGPGGVLMSPSNIPGHRLSVTTPGARDPRRRSAPRSDGAAPQPHWRPSPARGAVRRIAANARAGGRQESRS